MRGAWGQMMEGEGIGFSAVMATEVMSSPPLEDSKHVGDFLPVRGWLKWPLHFPLHFLFLYC